MEQDLTNIHIEVLDRFNFLREKKMLAHAYLFIGPKEVGKSETALVLAKMLNCENSSKTKHYCDQCSSCLKINQGNHVDVQIVESEEGSSTIKIDQVRDLLNQVRLRPFEAEIKIFIIKNIEELTPEGANALLKTLEEPTSSSLLLLTTSVIEKVLATVRSRCQPIYFLARSSEEVIQHLEGEYVESFSASHFLAYFSDGCLKKAVRLRDEEFFELKNEYLNEFLFHGNSDNFIKDISSDKERSAQFIRVLLSWIRDAMLLKAGVDDMRLVHLDRKDELDNFQIRFSFNQLNDIYNHMVSTYQLLMDKLNIRMSLMILKEMLHG